MQKGMKGCSFGSALARTSRVSVHTVLLLTILLLPATAQTPPATSGAPTNASSAGNDVANPLPAIWFADHTSAKQLEVATDRITQIIPLAHEARALAIDPNDKSLWVLSHKHLLKFDAQTSLILDLDLKTLLPKPIKKDNKGKKEKDSREEYEEIEETDQLVLNPYDSSLWIGAGKILLHLDSQGKLLFTWRATEKIEAIALSLDESLWLLGKKQLLHLSTQGTVLNTYPLKPLADTEDGHFRALAIDALSGILWLASEDALYQTNLADLSVKPPVRIYPTASQTPMSHEEEGEDEHEDEEIASLALDLLTGTLWVTTKHTLLSFNRSGALLTTLALRPQGLKRADILAFDPPTQSLWLGGKKTLAHFSNNGSLIAKISLDEKLRALGITPFKLTPGITLVQPLPDALSNNTKLPIHLGLSAICNNASCNIDSAYLNALVFNVTLNGTQIGNLFTNTHGEATYIPSERYPEGINTFTAQARDGFGHTSNTLTGRFTIDTIPPEIHLGTPTVTLTRTPTQVFSGNVSEPASLLLNDQPILLDADKRFSQPVALKEGLNTFILTATDLAGNITRRTIPITLDTIPPRFLSLTPADGGAFTTPEVTIQGAVDDATASVILEDLLTLGGEITSADPSHFSFKVRLKTGPNTISLLAQDPAGNVARTSLRLTYNANSVKVTNLTSGATVNSNSTPIIGTFEGSLNTGITVNGIVAFTYGNQFSVNNVPLKPGENTLTIIATTLDGNTTIQTLTVNSIGTVGIMVERLTNESLLSITTFAGNGVAGFSGDGNAASQAKLDHPLGIAVGPDRSLYIADPGNNRIRRVNPEGIIITVAGSGSAGFSGDSGPAVQAQLNSPTDVAVGNDGNLYIADLGNNRIRRVTPDGIITTVAGNGRFGFSGDNGPAVLARLNSPFAVAVSPDGGLYIADTSNHRIRRVNTNGIITTIAGLGLKGYNGDQIPAVDSQLNTPIGLAFDANGGLYIADLNNNRIRKITSDGIIATVAGTGIAGGATDGQPATQSALNHPHDIAIDPEGNLYIADSDNFRIRKVGTDGRITTIAGTGVAGDGGDGGKPSQAQIAFPWGLAIDSEGNLYFADRDNNRIRTFTTLSASGTLAPLLVAFKLTNNTGNTIQKIEVDFDGNGAIDFTSVNSNALLQHYYTSPGIYLAKFVVTDSQNQIYTQTLVVMLTDPQQMDQLFNTLWTGLNQALVRGDINTATKHLNESAKQKYQPVFQTLLPHMPEIVASYSPMARISLSEDIGEYAIKRQINGQNQIYLIYFLRDADGVWRLDAM